MQHFSLKKTKKISLSGCSFYTPRLLCMPKVEGACLGALWWESSLNAARSARIPPIDAGIGGPCHKMAIIARKPSPLKRGTKCPCDDGQNSTQMWVHTAYNRTHRRPTGAGRGGGLSTDEHSAGTARPGPRGGGGGAAAVCCGYVSAEGSQVVAVPGPSSLHRRGRTPHSAYRHRQNTPIILRSVASAVAPVMRAAAL